MPPSIVAVHGSRMSEQTSPLTSDERSRHRGRRPLEAEREQEKRDLRDAAEDGSVVEGTYHEWYLPERYFLEYQLPILFEDGMDSSECEAYYAARYSGGFMSGNFHGSGHGKKRTFQKDDFGSGKDSDSRTSLRSILKPSSYSKKRFEREAVSTQNAAPATRRVSYDVFPAVRRASYAGAIGLKSPSLVNTWASSPELLEHRKIRDAAALVAALMEDGTEEDDDDDGGEEIGPLQSRPVWNPLGNPSNLSCEQPPVIPERQPSLLIDFHNKSSSMNHIMDMMDGSVSFCPDVHVTTIPRACEYPSDVQRALWNTRSELKSFLRQATRWRRRRSGDKGNDDHDDDYHHTDQQTTKERDGHEEKIHSREQTETETEKEAPHQGAYLDHLDDDEDDEVWEDDQASDDGDEVVDEDVPP